MARKVRPSDLGQSIAPAANGDGFHAATDIGPQVATARVSSPFPPIAEYAFLSDCEVNCLIAPSGRVEWMCLPRPDSPSVFAAIDRRPITKPSTFSFVRRDAWSARSS